MADRRLRIDGRKNLKHESRALNSVLFVISDSETAKRKSSDAEARSLSFSISYPQSAVNNSEQPEDELFEFVEVDRLGEVFDFAEACLVNVAAEVVTARTIGCDGDDGNAVEFFPLA